MEIEDMTPEDWKAHDEAMPDPISALRAMLSADSEFERDVLALVDQVRDKHRAELARVRLAGSHETNRWLTSELDRKDEALREIAGRHGDSGVHLRHPDPGTRRIALAALASTRTHADSRGST